jgi:uncharacterized protein (DUF1800 family)
MVVPYPGLVTVGPSREAVIAHVLRRTTFGPFPGQVKALAPKGVKAAIEGVLAAKALGTTPAPAITDDGSNAPVHWWLDRMANPNAGIHERMTWFWHGHLTTSHSKVFRWKIEFPQHLLLRQYALGDFRALLHKITLDPAMLVYLDGSWSISDDPNENYSRELMELFVLGRGNYSQDDVHNGARALAGWYVDYDTGKVGFNDWAALDAAVTYLGAQVKRAPDVINAVLAHPASAPWVVSQIHQYLTGRPAGRSGPGLAATFRSSGFQVRPIVEAIVRDPNFLRGRLNRARTPVEWLIPAMAALGLTDKDLRIATLYDMGQLPFHPPSVVGWPSGLRWLSPSFALARAAFATDATGLTEVANAADSVSAALTRCSLYEVSPTTRAALTSAAAGVSDPKKRAAVLLGLAVASPEFALA